MEGIVNSPLHGFITTPTNVRMSNDFFTSCVQQSNNQHHLFTDDCFDVNDFDMESFFESTHMSTPVNEVLASGESQVEQGYCYNTPILMEPTSVTSQPSIGVVIERPVPIVRLPEKIVEKTRSVAVPSGMDGAAAASSVDLGECATITSGSSWTIVKVDPSIIKDDCSTQITIRSRKCKSDTPDLVEDQMYSSVTYEMKHEAFGSFLNEIEKSRRVVLVKVQVIDAKTGLEINRNNQSILSTPSEGAISRTSNDRFVHDMKLKFSSCSYHFDRASFKFRVSYTCQNIDEPFLVKESTEFKVFARKPTEATSRKPASDATSGKKRKRSAKADDESDGQSSKRTKSSQPMSKALTSFASNLTDLFSCLDQMSQDERRHAVSMLALQVGSCPDFLYLNQ